MEQAGLSAVQDQALKAIARGFVNAFPALSYRQRIALARRSRSQLRTSLGYREFKRFDEFLHKKIAPNTIYGAFSDIYVNEAAHELVGVSQTTFYSRPSEEVVAAPMACGGSVSATMTGPGVSLSGSGVCGDQDSSVSVRLTSPSYQPNSQYCIDGTHAAVSGGTATTRGCITTPGEPQRVTGVEYELIQTDDLPIDTNPNAGGGRRIFPDSKIPNETIDRRKIRVKAQLSQAAAGARIYFRNFDVDDPSSDVAPIDTNDTATVKTGSDNNGNVDGTVATRGGQMIVPAAGQPNAYNCQAFSNASASGVSCETDATGVTKLDFIVTRQPGDNFAVVAGPDETYVSSLISAADGINLKDPSNIQTPVTTTASNGCANSTITACRADMLTVWRRLHIEVDSMGPAHENYERGNVDKKATIEPGKSKKLEVTTSPLETNRFEKGRMELAFITGSLDIVSNAVNTLTVRNSTNNDIVLASGTNYELLSQDGANSAIGNVPGGVTLASLQTLTYSVAATPMVENAFSMGSMFITPVLRSLTIDSNTQDKVTVTNNTTATIEIEAATHIRLYDDDDMENTSPTNAGSALNGDEGDDVVEPDLSLLTDNSSNPANNVFAPAYIVPRYDLMGGGENVPFVANVAGTRIALDNILSNTNGGRFNNFSTESSLDFWTVYLLGGFQFNEFSNSPNGTLFDTDGDPYTLVNGRVSSTYGAANVSNDPINNTRFNDGYGAIIFTELGRPHEFPSDYASRPVSRAYTTVHEVGHLFSCQHGEGGLMEITQTRVSGIFSDTSLSWIRKNKHP